jgi:hypothetical protein
LEFTASSTGFEVSTADVAFGLSHFQNVYGTSRIVGGGVFEFIFDPSDDLLTDADFRSVTATAFHGLGSYAAPGTVTFPVNPVPEPGTISLLAPSLVLAWRWRYRGGRVVSRRESSHLDA